MRHGVDIALPMIEGARRYNQHGVAGASKRLSDAFAYVSAEGAKHWLYATGYDIGEVSEKVERKYAPFG